TMCAANMLPSTIDTLLRVDQEEARLVLEHQVGPHVQGIYLQLFVVDSTWHVMARISIARLGDAAERSVKPVDGGITAQLRPLPEPGPRLSSINRVFNAALGKLLDQGSGKRYAEIYQRYIGIAPRFAPTSAACDPWVARPDRELAALLA